MPTASWRNVLSLTLLAGFLLALAPLWIYSTRQVDVLAYLKSSPALAPGADTDARLVARFRARPGTDRAGYVAMVAGLALAVTSVVLIVRRRRADPTPPVYRRPTAGILAVVVGAITSVVATALTIYALAIGPVTDTMRFVQAFTVMPLVAAGFVVGMSLSIVSRLLDANRRPALYGIWLSILPGPLTSALYFTFTRWLVAAVALVLLAGGVATAQDSAWKVGDTVRARQKYGTWYDAVIVETRDGRYRVRWTTSKAPEDEWFDGSRICSKASPVLTSGEGCPPPFRTPAGAAAAPPAAPPAPGAQKAPTPPAAKPPAREIPVAGPGTTKAAGAPMSQSEILEYLQTRIGNDPVHHPKKREVVQELVAMIRARGVAFRWETLSDFANKLAAGGDNERTVGNAIAVNYGPPTAQPWLFGTWDLTKIGATVDYVRGNKVYRQTEAGALVGSVVIDRNGSFTWNAPDKKITGKWRPATDAEMRLQGGAGLVLLDAKTGYDWLVSKSTNLAFKGDSVDIVEIKTRQIREFGGRR